MRHVRQGISKQDIPKDSWDLGTETAFLVP